MLLRHPRRSTKLHNYRLEFKIMSLFALIVKVIKFRKLRKIIILKLIKIIILKLIKKF